MYILLECSFFQFLSFSIIVTTISVYQQMILDKIETFREDSGTKKALHLTMVTTYGVKRGTYSNRVQSQITLDDLFT